MSLTSSGVIVNNDGDAVLIGREDASDYNPQNILPESSENIERIRSWLQPTSYEIAGGEYRKHRASHVAGTGAWLTSNDAYCQWLQGDEQGTLWIKGIPGSGKSVVAANLIHELAKAHPGVPVLFFFFRQIIKANHEPRALMRDWMDQILDYSPPLQQQLLVYVKESRPVASLSMEDLWRYLRMAFASLPGKVFCVADALDEIDQGYDSFLQDLGSLGQWRPGKVKVLVTSRPVLSVEGPLRQTPCLQIRLEEDVVDVDIATYVETTLSDSPIPQRNWKVIREAVPGRANGLFLYAKLAMDAFLEPEVDIEEVLLRLPKDLNILYTSLLHEHARRSGIAPKTQQLILTSVTHASRPLRLIELAEMIRVYKPDNSTRDLKAAKDLIRAACGPLLEILPDETVSVIHHSFTEYLKGATRSYDDAGYPILQPGPAHAPLGVACLRYLKAGCLDNVNITFDELEENANTSWMSLIDEQQPDQTTPLRLQFPLFDYATNNWHFHISRSDAAGYEQTETNEELSEFLKSSQLFRAWLQITQPFRAVGVTPLHICAKEGLSSYVRRLLVETEVDVLDSVNETPLWCAASNGHAVVMRDLIAAGANIRHTTKDSRPTPLHAAVAGNHYEACKVLLEAGADPMEDQRQSGGSKTPFRDSCCHGFLDIFELFLPFVKNLKTTHLALGWAAKNGRSKLVARILQLPGVDVNAKEEGETALFLACEQPDIPTITTLLQAGSDPNIYNEGGRVEKGGGCVMDYFWSFSQANCLHQLCGQGSWRKDSYSRDYKDPGILREVLSLLLQAGLDIEQRTIQERTALHGTGNSPILTRLLLDAGADVNAIDESGSSPLFYASDPDCIALLIEQGHADINLKRSDGQTPLLFGLESLSGFTNYSHKVLKLLEYGPDCTIVDDKGDGALHKILESSGNADILKALIVGGADPNLKNKSGETPLTACNGRKYSLDILDLLVEAGADINAVDAEGKTLLFKTLKAPFFKEIKELVKRGASTSICDSRGRTVLHEALLSNNDEMFNCLIGLGLDVQLVYNSGNGLLHELAAVRESLRDEKRWKRLIHLGLDLDQCNHVGRTPLHILCASAGLSGLNFVLLHTKNIDAADNDGRTPLHIAIARGDEYLTKKLLDAGANPITLGKDGFTPLHAACRDGQSNVVGMMLDALRHRQAETLGMFQGGAKEQGAFLNKVLPEINVLKAHTDNVTPLYYACVSGRPETVRLLLEAGADPNIGNIFAAFLEFNIHQSEGPSAAPDPGTNSGNFAKTFSEQSVYQNVARDESDLRDYETTRLHEILDMIVDNGADISKIARKDSDIIQQAAEEKNVYVAECLMATLAMSPRGTTLGTSESWVMPARKSMRDSVNEHPSSVEWGTEFVKPGDRNILLFNHFMARREYHLVEELAGLGATFLPVPKEPPIGCGIFHVVGSKRRKQMETNVAGSNMATLIQHGFFSLVEKIGQAEAASRLEHHDWHAFGDRSQPGLWFANRDISTPEDETRNPVPFLLDAVKRERPNMDVVRLLVERFNVDIDELYQDAEGGLESALLYVAQGRCWWHDHQALPYLIEAGVNKDIPDHDGKTPLMRALETNLRSPAGLFHSDAAKVLINAGADVNKMDARGNTPLVYAEGDSEMIKCLIAHGAKTNPDSLFAAIDAGNLQVLEALLSGGFDVNLRRKKPLHEQNSKSVRGRGSYYIESNEVFPLYYAAMYYHPRESEEKAEPGALVQCLLAHGVDPFATFMCKKGRENHVLDAEFSKGGSSTMLPEGYQECTILHEIIFNQRAADSSLGPFLRLPGIDVNTRDARGWTLLHAACRDFKGADRAVKLVENGAKSNQSTLFQSLVALGADVGARDNFGRNVIHHMMNSSSSSARFDQSFEEAMKMVPDLLNQADGDGRTPLHYALTWAEDPYDTRDYQYVTFLLSKGANPLAVAKNGDNALHMLAEWTLDDQGIRDLFCDLARRGVDVNGRNVCGETPLFAFANRKSSWDHGRGRFSAQSPSSPLSPCFSSSDSGTEDESTEKSAWPMLEDLGADFFARDNRGRTLLHVAARGAVERFEELLEKGIDPLLEDDKQQTAIDIAVACGNKNILTLFKSKKNKALSSNQ